MSKRAWIAVLFVAVVGAVGLVWAPHIIIDNDDPPRRLTKFHRVNLDPGVVACTAAESAACERQCDLEALRGGVVVVAAYCTAASRDAVDCRCVLTTR